MNKVIPPTNVYPNTCETPEHREVSESPRKQLVLTPWTLQSMVQEVIGYALTQNPQELGFSFPSNKSQTPCDANQVKVQTGGAVSAQNQSQVPSVTVRRSDVGFSAPTMGQLRGTQDIANSVRSRWYLGQFHVHADVVGNPIQEAEQIQDFLRFYFLDFEEQIRNDFNLRRFRLSTMHAPTPTQGAQQNTTYTVTLTIEVAYDHGAVIQQEALKLKTISWYLFDRLTCKDLLASTQPSS